MHGAGCASCLMSVLCLLNVGVYSCVFGFLVWAVCCMKWGLPSIWRDGGLGVVSHETHRWGYFLRTKPSNEYYFFEGLKYRIQGGLTKHHACFCIALEANPHNFPITPARGGESGALPRIRENFRGVDLPALPEPMKQHAPVQIFLRYLTKPAPFQTFIGNRGVHVTTMVHQHFTFTREVGLQSGQAALLGRWVARLLINMRVSPVVDPLLVDP